MSSYYKLYSIGKVIKTAERGAEFILFTPIEILYDQKSGRIEDNNEEQSGMLLTVNQPSMNTEHVASNYDRARWRNMGGGNRMTPPNVSKGETVNIYKYGNNAEYYWDKIGNETQLRGQEDVVYGFSNRKEDGDPDGEKPSLENSAYIRVNTIDGYIQIKTPTNNGEKAGWNVKIDFSGLLHISDTNNNQIDLRSVEGELQADIVNRVTINTIDAEVNCERSVTNCEHFDVNASEKITLNTPLVEMTKDVHILGETTIDGFTTINNDALITGNLELGGALTGGTGGGGAPSVFNGDLRSTGDISSVTSSTTGDNHVGGDLTVDGSFPCKV